ncbi:MAG: HNH endonuclease [Methanobrevibacter sp.]|nr:HNH endonuclease [Methanosphaera sp.]MBR0369203.1 HNH endonuclease [Methanobrevibacter sp.]
MTSSVKSKMYTRFGTCLINGEGYYEVASVKEGNQDKLLHRLIYMDFYGVDLPSNIHIHHRNNRKLDNCILNLEAIPASDHARLHRTGAKMSEETKLLMSKARSKTNIFHVSKEKSKGCRQGFIYKYQYFEDGVRKKMRAVDLEVLKSKVLDKGLPWIEFRG